MINSLYKYLKYKLQRYIYIYIYKTRVRTHTHTRTHKLLVTEYIGSTLLYTNETILNNLVHKLSSSNSQQRHDISHTMQFVITSTIL